MWVKSLKIARINNVKALKFSKIFCKLQGPAAQAEQALTEFKTLITSARFK